MECAEASGHLPGYLDGAGGPAALDVAAHLRTCDRCRAELDGYRQMREALASLATTTIEPPAWLLGATIDAVAARLGARGRLEQLRHGIPAAAGGGRQRLADPRIAAGAAAVVVAGVAAGAVFARGRRRRRLVRARLRAATASA